MHSCGILRFPAIRRIGHIQNVARLLASYRPDTAERTIATQLTVQRQTMLRRSLPTDIVQLELQMLEHTPRAALSNVIFGGDAA